MTLVYCFYALVEQMNEMHDTNTAHMAFVASPKLLNLFPRNL